MRRTSQYEQRRATEGSDLQPVYNIQRSGRWVRVNERAYAAWSGHKRITYERRHA